MIRALCLTALLALGGCAVLPMVLSGIASAVTIGKDVLDIDMSLSQQKPGKTPLRDVTVPVDP